MLYNPFTLKGKTILITGASSGIGRATAIECSKLGATCIITARNEERLNETLSQMEGEGHLVICADLSAQEGIDFLVGNVPELDGLVSNAGIATKKTISFYKQELLNEIFQTNAFVPMLLIRTLLKRKKIRLNASLVFTSSIAAFKSDYGNGIYGASKAALTSYTHYCARELASKKIRVNAVHPGMVDTPLIHEGTISEDELQQDMQTYPLGRYGKPEEIAWSIIYLLSDASTWVTGTNMIIDGGLLVK